MLLPCETKPIINEKRIFEKNHRGLGNENNLQNNEMQVEKSEILMSRQIVRQGDQEYACKKQFFGGSLDESVARKKGGLWGRTRISLLGNVGLKHSETHYVKRSQGSHAHDNA